MLINVSNRPVYIQLRKNKNNRKLLSSSVKYRYYCTHQIWSSAPSHHLVLWTLAMVIQMFSPLPSNFCLWGRGIERSLAPARSEKWS